RVKQAIQLLELLHCQPLDRRRYFNVAAGELEFHFVSLPLDWRLPIADFRFSYEKRGLNRGSEVLSNRQSEIANRQSNYGAAFPRAGDSHLVSILGHGAAAHLHTVPRQAFGYFIIGDGMVWILVFDHLLYFELEHASRDVFAGVAAHSLGEKAPQLIHALRRVDVLAIHHTRNRAQVHADVFRDVLEHHWL